LAASAISSVATVEAQEENETERPVSIEDIPAPARDAILSQVGAGIVTEVVEETRPGREPVYEGHINQGKRKGVVRVDAAGNILEFHRVI
jgi:hypothetical protein